MPQAPGPRIHGGIARGRRLQCPPGDHTRPTMGKAKEALMSIVGPRLPEARWLDAYAGSGGVGLEAWSRGAASITFIEQDPAALRALQANLEQLGCRCATVMPQAVASALPRLAPASFDLIFADPPFVQDPAEVAELLGRSGLLVPGGCLILEHAGGRAGPAQAGPCVWQSTRRYGATAFSFYTAP